MSMLAVVIEHFQLLAENNALSGALRGAVIGGVIGAVVGVIAWLLKKTKK